jgi:hypothetical protein
MQELYKGNAHEEKRHVIIAERSKLGAFTTKAGQCRLTRVDSP